MKISRDFLLSCELYKDSSSQMSEYWRHSEHEQLDVEVEVVTLETESWRLDILDDPDPDWLVMYEVLSVWQQSQ